MLLHFAGRETDNCVGLIL